MTQLAPNLFQRRFEDLMEIGRARIPALAPEWTDHNAHDPGITLIELLAWVAEAQLYSLSHVRRDERTAYAALLGIEASGTKGATGLIWNDREDSTSPAATFTKTAVIPEDAAIRIVGKDAPIFNPLRKLLWIPGRIEKLETRGVRGTRTDNTTMNERGSAAFMPFGTKAGPRDVLTMKFACRDKEGMFGSDRPNTKGAYWPIGVQVAPPVGDPPLPESGSKVKRSRLTATLVTDKERVALKVEVDTTRGFLNTGVVLLDLDDVATSHKDFTIELRSPAGFARPPRVLRIEPNVIPIQQGKTISGEIHPANGLPDFNFVLNDPGLKFGSGKEPVTVDVVENGKWSQWRRCKRLSDEGPDGVVYEFDSRTTEITFGNGVNGRVPASGAQVRVTYKVSDGEGGNVARNRKWNVAGFKGVFGVNPDPVGGGSDASDFRLQRREARRRVRKDHALVTSSDIEAAAKGLTLLEVARAWVVNPSPQAPRTGAVTLVALRKRPDENEPDEPPETSRWLDAIRRYLIPRIPLGTRLSVMRPSYRDFSIQAVVEVYQGRNPDTVEKAIGDDLRKHLALTGPEARPPGVAVNKRDVAAWIRGVDGVKSITDLQLLSANGDTTDAIDVLRGGLPRWRDSQSTIRANRAGSGGAQ